MKRFHNPMSYVMVVLLILMFVALNCLYIATKYIPTPAYFIVIAIIALFVVITLWGELKFKKSDKLFGDDYNTTQELANDFSGNPKQIIIAIISTLFVIGGFVALCMYNAYIGVPVFVVFCLGILGYALYKTRRGLTVEKYILGQKKAIRPLLQAINDVSLQFAPNVETLINGKTFFPTFVYVKYHSEDNFSVFSVLAFQAIIGGKSICIYPYNRDAFKVFADRIKGYNNNGNSEVFLPTNKPMNLELIKDIVEFNISQIETISENNSGNFAN
jgi:protein-S-isoprenylcysteine O-methyltransferase Ste14